jgi:hypothetical protein
MELEEDVAGVKKAHKSWFERPQNGIQHHINNHQSRLPNASVATQKT